jgi:hypothetical protein
MRRARVSLVVVSLVAALIPLVVPVAAAARPIERINQVVAIFQENWRFDGL